MIRKIYKTVYLYLPHQLTETFNTAYDRAALGPFGSAAVDAVSGRGDMDTFTIKSKMVLTLLSRRLHSVLLLVSLPMVSGAIGVDGNLSKNQLAALAKGKVFNPYEETVFRGVNYRQHNFDFDMAPRNGEEASSIRDIILTLRDSMLPDTSDGDKWLTVPRFFRAEIVRYTPGKLGNQSGNKISRPQSLATLLTYPVNMVLTGLQVNMTPTGQNNSIRRGDET